jgi:hypothetical protein
MKTLNLREISGMDTEVFHNSSTLRYASPSSQSWLAFPGIFDGFTSYPSPLQCWFYSGWSWEVLASFDLGRSR